MPEQHIHDDYNDRTPGDRAIDTWNNYLNAPFGSTAERDAITSLVRALLAINESAVLDALTDPDDEPDPAGFERVLAITDLAHARDEFIDALARHIVTIEDGVGDPDQCESHALKCARGVIAASDRPRDVTGWLIAAASVLGGGVFLMVIKHAWRPK